jgi:hypothetical protein
MNTANSRARILLIAGYLAMLIGAIDPMEGSLLILPGSGLVVLGTWLGGQQQSAVIFRMSVFFLILFGVAAIWGTSMLGGIGSTTAYSMWWALLMVPYPIGWSMGIWGPDSPRWVLWSGIGVGIWYVMMMFLMINMSSRWTESTVEAVSVAGSIGIIGAVTIIGCIYRLRKLTKA